MAANGFPVDAIVELRGVAPASTFVARDTGDVVNVPAKAKLEYQMADGDVGQLEISATQIAKAAGGVDLAQAVNGEQFRVTGVARDGDRGMYLQLVSFEREAA